MQGSISMAAAKLTDAVAVERLLAPSPDAAKLRELLRPGFRGAVDAYHAATRTARYVRANGDLVTCFILADVSQQEAIAVGDALETVSDLGYASFESAVRSVMKVQTIRIRTDGAS